MFRKLIFVALIVSSFVACPSAFAVKGSARMEEMSTERWALLRETERYQMNVAEGFYRKGDYKVAAGEYEKFVTLYELSEGAPYAQLKWSLCQTKIKKLNTAIKDGFQTVIDYWPDSPEAVASAYLIGKTYKEMGDLGPAKTAYQNVLTKHPDEMIAILARLDLADIHRIEQDRERRIAVLKDLVFNAPRAGDAGRQIVEASITLSFLLFEDAAFVAGKEVLATSYQEPALARVVYSTLASGHGNLNLPSVFSRLPASGETAERRIRLADAAIEYFRQQQPLAPKDEAEHDRAKQMAYDIANMHALVGRMSEAEKIYDQLLKTYKNEDGVLVQYASWLWSQNKHDEARSVYGRMKNQIDGQKRVALSYWEERRYLLAVPIYETLMTTDKEHAADHQWSLAEAYRHGGKYKEAIAVFQQSDRFPQCLTHMALCYRALKQYREAMGLYTQVIGGYESAAASALLDLAYTQEEAGQTEKAIATFQQVCKKYPRTEQGSKAHQHLNNKYKITFTLGGAKDE